MQRGVARLLLASTLSWRPPGRSTTAVLVILAWIVGWSALGAWPMMTRGA
ncbi:MAG: hypothetical protein M3O28_07025 [Actinomycetota bacterium]|nr:hypothetical protein [Actinomycetota bacterium]